MDTQEDLDRKLRQAAGLGKKDDVVQLLKSGANVNARTPFFGWTALFEAASAGHADVVAVLLEHGADRSIPSQGGVLPLQVAQDKGHKAVVALLSNESPLTSPRRPTEEPVGAQALLVACVDELWKHCPNASAHT